MVTRCCFVLWSTTTGHSVAPRAVSEEVLEWLQAEDECEPPTRPVHGGAVEADRQHTDAYFLALVQHVRIVVERRSLVSVTAL